MTETDVWAYWRAALAYKANPEAVPKPDFDKNHPEQGYYRNQYNGAVAIWWTSGGHCKGRVTNSDNVRDYDKADQIGDSLFAYCCRNPISWEAYKEFERTRRWPEDVEASPKAVDRQPGSTTITSGRRKEAHEPANGFVPPNDEPPQGESGTTGGESGTDRPNMPQSAEGALAAELDDLLDQIAEWLRQIGGKIVERVQADKMANYAKAIEAIEKRAENARKAEKLPWDEGAKLVQARFMPLLDRAEAAKRRVKGHLLPFLSAEKQKANEEAARLAEINRQRQADGQPLEQPPVAGPRSMAGTRGRVSLQTRTVYDIESLPDAAMYLATLDNPPSDFVEAVRKAGGALIKAGVDVPGMDSRTVDVVA